MSRVQLALNVADLDEAIAFYSTLFRTGPAKVRDGYANFAIAEPPLKLVLIAGGGAPGTMNHVGVEVETTDEVSEAIQRFPGRGPRNGCPAEHGVLLRGTGQGVGAGPRHRVGDLHGPRRRARHGVHADRLRHVRRCSAPVGVDCVCRMLLRAGRRRLRGDGVLS